MTIEQTRQIIQLLKEKDVHFETGLTDDEILQVEIKFNLKFPPDLKLFLQTALPTSKGFVNWRLGLKSNEEATKIIDRINWPLEGMLFDLENNEFWINSWGVKPDTYEEKARIAKKKYLTFPKLIPIFSHRYIPSEPSEEGNPIFSVHQMDIIYYGYSLPVYFSNEFHFILPPNFEIKDEPRNIRFWSNWIDEWTKG